MPFLAYKKNAAEVIQRLTGFIEGRAQDRIFASFTLPSNAMKKFKARYAESFFSEYPDPYERIEFWEEHLKNRTHLEDDTIPCAYPSEFDQGLYGGVFGGDVRFLAMASDGYVSSGWISSMIPPLLRSWADFSSLEFDEECIWHKRYERQLGIMAEKASGNFGISHLILIDGLNFVFELVGATNTYLSIMENPDMVKKGIDLGFDVNIKIHDTFFRIVPLLEGGTCSWVVPWLPGRIVCESVDPFHMTSIDYFEKWGREPAERTLSQYDGGVLHIHLNGRHLLETVCTIKGLRAILMVDEKDHPPAYSILTELRRRTGELPMSIYVNLKDFADGLKTHTLTGGTFYYVNGAGSEDEVNRIMEKVRNYRV